MLSTADLDPSLPRFLFSVTKKKKYMKKSEIKCVKRVQVINFLSYVKETWKANKHTLLKERSKHTYLTWFYGVPALPTLQIHPSRPVYHFSSYTR